WLDETRDERILVADLEQASLLWQRRGRRDAETWSGAALAEATRKGREGDLTLAPVSRAVLDASLQRDRRVRRRRRRMASGIFAALIAAALGAGIGAVAVCGSHRPSSCCPAR